jgi:dihydrofolate reductase
MKATVFVGMSLDGFIARTDGTYDFLHAAENENAGSYGFEEFMATVDALVMGRNTFETVRVFGKWPYGSTPVIVLTTRSPAAAPAGASVEFMSGEPAEIVARLAARGIDHIYVDGGETIQRFLRAGLITHLVLSRVPVIIGTGISIFGALEKDIQLRHIATREFPGGMVQSEYDVIK